MRRAWWYTVSKSWQTSDTAHRFFFCASDILTHRAGHVICGVHRVCQDRSLSDSVARFVFGPQNRDPIGAQLAGTHLSGRRRGRIAS